MLEELKRIVCEANRELGESGLAPLTFGNVSGFDQETGLFAIKPSGVAYDQLTPAQMVVVDLEGAVVDGDLQPSSDAPTHRVLYRDLADLGGIVHMHSPHATTLCQMGQELPCLGTTHADYFGGTVPLARALTRDEVRERYEEATGVALVETFAALDPLVIPAVLQHHHAPFTWGVSVADALVHARVLELSAGMALAQLASGVELAPIPDHIAQYHWQRKHGPDAYYGQR